MLLFCFKHCLGLIYNMGPKKSRKIVRKIKITADKPTEFELGDTAADIQRSREERTEGETTGETTEGGEGEVGSQEVGGYSAGAYFTGRGDSA